MDKLRGRVAITGSVAFVPQVLSIHGHTYYRHVGISATVDAKSDSP
jgi:hypothetical protein